MTTQPATVPELTDAEERRWLLYGQYTAPWQEGLVEAIIKWGELENVPGPEDVDHVDPSWLPLLAISHRALTYTTIFGVEYERRAIKSAPWYNRWAGYWAAMHRFAEDAEFEYEYAFLRWDSDFRTNPAYTRDGYIEGVNIYVTKSLSFPLSDADYIRYLTETIPLLMPYYFRVVNVIIADQNTVDAGLAVLVDQRAFSVIGA